MKILLFIDSNIKTIPYEVPLLELRQWGHEIIFLSILEHGPIHEEYKALGMPVFSIGEKQISLKRSFGYVQFFIRFCKENKVEAVYAHLGIPSFISVWGQHFIKAKVICFRHHFNFINLLPSHSFKVNKVDKWMDKINARLCKKMVLPSAYLRTLIHQYEGVPMEKMEVIPYVYNWEPFISRAIAKKDPAEGTQPIKLLMISRLTSLKRPELAIKLLTVLQQAKQQVELTIVGTGDLEAPIRHLVQTSGLAGKVHFAGFQKDVVPFLNECDVLVHPSLTEASSSVIKEAGIIGRPVIVCKGVGDFNDYIVSGQNGWAVDPDRFVEEAKNIVQSTSAETNNRLGLELRRTILARFSLSNEVLQAYQSLIS